MDNNELITKIRTSTGDHQIDYNALANLPDIYSKSETDNLLSEKASTSEIGEIVSQNSYNKTEILSNDSAALYGLDITWEKKPGPVKGNFYRIAYGNGRFVAVQDGVHTMYSDDGKTWTQGDDLENSNYHEIAFGNGKFVVTEATSSNIYYSSNGINWAKVTIPGGYTWFRSICFGNGKFVTLNYSYAKAAYSDNAINWTVVDLPESGNFTSICYGNGVFVGISNYIKNFAVCSTNGVTWSKVTLPTPALQVNAGGDYTNIIFECGKFIFLQNGTNVCVYSENGTTWNQSYLPIKANWHRLASGNGKILAADERIGAYSSDGVTWEPFFYKYSMKCLAFSFADQKFVAIHYATGDTFCGTFSDTCVPNDILQAIKSYLNFAFDSIHIQSGRYYGTGNYSDNNVLTVGFRPSLFIIQGGSEDPENNPDLFIFQNKWNGAGIRFSNSTTKETVKFSFTNSGISISSSNANAGKMANLSNGFYAFLAIGHE